MKKLAIAMGLVLASIVASVTVPTAHAEEGTVYRVLKRAIITACRSTVDPTTLMTVKLENGVYMTMDFRNE